MGHFSCVVQEESSASRKTEELSQRLTALHRARYPGDEATVSWRAVPAGFMFTEGRQSTSSIIACVMPWPTNVEQRESYMRGVCDVWTEVTGCTDHEVVVAVTEFDPL